MADISKVTLPNGQTYNIKDAVARQMISGGIDLRVVWSKSQQEGSTAPTTEQKAQIPNAATIYYNGGSSTATGTLAPSADTVGTFYLVAGYAADPTSSTTGGDFYDEWVTVNETPGQTTLTYKWEKIGDTQFTGDLALASSSFISSLESGNHSHSYDKTTSVTIASGTTGDVTVATGSLSTNAAVALASSSSTSAGAITYIQDISAAASNHTHSATVETKYIKATRSTDAAIGTTDTWIGATATGGGHSSPTISSDFITALASTAGTVSGASSYAVATLTPTSKKLTTISVYPAKSITTSDFVTSGTTTKFGKVNVLSSVSGSVTAVASATSATVATGSLTDSGSGAYVVTNVTAPNTVQGVSAVNNLIQNANQPTGTNAGTGVPTLSTTVDNETLVFAWASNTSVNSASQAAATTLTVASSRMATTSVNSANAPSSISVSMSSTTSNVISSSEVATGASVNIITALAKDSTTIDTRDTSVTVATGSLSETSATTNVGSTIVESVASTRAYYLTGLSGDTTFIKTVAVGSSAAAVTALGNFTVPTISLSNGASGEGKASALYTASMSTQPIVTLASGTSADLAVGAPGSITVNATETSAVTGTTRYLTTSVSQQPILATTKISATPNHTSTDSSSVSTVIGPSVEAYAVTSVGLS